MVLLASGIWAGTIRAENASSQPPPVGTAWELAVQRAREHIRYGLNLGSRRAIYAAQVEFVRALRLIARELDAASGTHEHEVALAAGWRSMETLEYVNAAELPSRPSSRPGLHDLQTPSGAGVSPGYTTAYQAMQQQLSRASEQLAFSGGREPTASMALYALGRSFIAATDDSPEEGPLAGPKAVALYQAALVVDPRNCLAINELSVLLTRCGQLADAERVLLQGLTLAPQPQMWHNLGMIHEKLGNTALAGEDRRRRDALLAVQRSKGEDPRMASLASVRWMEPAEFVRCSGSDDFGQPANQDAESPPRQQAVAERAEPTKDTQSSFPKWMPEWIVAEFKGSNRETSGGRTR
jgi:hypothetical protein